MLEIEEMGTTNLKGDFRKKGCVDLQKVTPNQSRARPKILVVMLGKGPSWARHDVNIDLRLL